MTMTLIQCKQPPKYRLQIKTVSNANENRKFTFIKCQYHNTKTEDRCRNRDGLEMLIMQSWAICGCSWLFWLWYQNIIVFHSINIRYRCIFAFGNAMGNSNKSGNDNVLETTPLMICILKNIFCIPIQIVIYKIVIYNIM